MKPPFGTPLSRRMLSLLGAALTRTPSAASTGS